MIKSLLREPLLHFLILGSAVFAVWVWRNPEPATPKPDKPQIVVTESRIDSLIDIWTKTRQRPPTQRELRGLIDDYLQEEIFYREALSLGLDKDDTIVRRRLRQKMELFVEDFASAAAPAVDELQEFLKTNADRFRVDRKVALRQIYLNPSRHADTLEHDIETLLEQLDANSAPEEYGDPFLLPASYEATPIDDLTRTFGADFGEQVYQQDLHVWSGPIPSGYGVHLVFVEEKQEGRLPRLEEIRSAVEREWFAQKRSEAKRRFFEELRNRYEIVIELPPASAEVKEPAS